MKPTTKRILIELAATAVASPLLLLLLLVTRALTVLAILAAPTIPLVRLLSGWIDTISPPPGGVWLSGLANAALAEVILLPIWTWFLLMVIVELFQRFKPRRETA
jgi:hypothetical protein